MFEIKLNSTISKNDLELLVSQYKYGRYCEDSSLSLESSRLLLQKNISDSLCEKINQHIAVYNSGNIRGILIFKESPWDTEHFGYKYVIIDYIIVKEYEYSQERYITKLLLKKFNNWCDDTKIRFVSVKIPSLNLPVLHEIENNNFNFIESWIFNKYDLKHLSKTDLTNVKLRQVVQEDQDIMLRYSKGAFSTQRFHADYWIDDKKADLLYEKWIKTAFADPKQDILVMDYEGKPVAFMIYYINDLRKYFNLNYAQWKMGLVDPQKQHKGIGFDFVKALFQFHKDQGVDIIDSGLSIRNIASLNWHNKLNFKIISTLVTFHKWYE